MKIIRQVIAQARRGDILAAQQVLQLGLRQEDSGGNCPPVVREAREEVYVRENLTPRLEFFCLSGMSGYFSKYRYFISDLLA